MQQSSLFVCPKPNPQAGLRLFCFPYAGANESIYYPWINLLPATIELWTIQLPGRNARLQEPAYQHIDDVTAALAHQMPAYLDKPFACFGHSLGALLAFNTMRVVRQLTQQLPRHLFFSGRRPPHQPNLLPPTHGLSNDEFVAEVQQRYGGIPAAILAEPELLAYFLPALRADFAVMESYVYQPDTPFACPISVFAGEEDALTPRSALAEWCRHTLNAFSLKFFPGGHFFLQSQRSALLQTIVQALSCEALRE